MHTLVRIAARATLAVGCRHTATQPGPCLLDPPSWAWNIGLGRLQWSLGQWAERHAS